MTRTDILARVQHCLRELGHDKPVDETTDLVKDLRLDSLARVELTMAIEDELDIEIPDPEAEKLVTVAQVLDYLDARRTAAGFTDMAHPRPA